jgi:peptidoglycan hydrolase-like protein with peptidoglycan-binding domain
VTWKLAPNLARRQAMVKAEWLHLDVYAIGDQAHQDRESDHNPDARGIVHAIDVMTRGDEYAAAQVLAWALSGRGDLEYVIHNRRIWDRSRGWAPREYLGTNPHTDHVHLSGRHGDVGKDKATGTGYDVTAEQVSPVALVDHKAGSRVLRVATSPLRGWDVVRLQSDIGLRGWHRDGIYGTATAAALTAWQRERGLDPDGIAGPLTWARLGHTWTG